MKKKCQVKAQTFHSETNNYYTNKVRNDFYER